MYEVDVNFRHNYVSEQTSERYRVDTLRYSTLVASKLTEKGWHAPALDIDGPSSLTRWGNNTLFWVDAPMKPREYRNIVKTLEQTHLGRRLNIPNITKLSVREKLYQKTRKDTLDWNGMWDIAKGLVPNFTGDFDELLAMSRALDEGQYTNGGPEMKNPWPILFHSNPILVPSSSEKHHHLYIQQPLKWEKYVKVMEALRDGKILEPGYVGASKHRDASCLRRPGYYKDSPEMMPELIF